MALKLYRRHRPACEGGHPEGSKSGEFEEGRRGWKRCACIIHASGSINRQFNRKQTGKSDWNEAKRVANGWETVGSWSSTPIAAPQPVVRERQLTTGAGVTIAEASRSYLVKSEHRGVKQSTLSKYRTFTKQLCEYADSRGYIMVDQLTVADMDNFYASWKDGIRSKAKKLERLKGFIRFCMRRKWLTENIAEDLEAPAGSSVAPNKAPFTDAELERMFLACDALGGPTPPGPGHRAWGGEDVKDFIMLSVYTGLRISDIATFDITKRLHGNDIFLRMHKTRKELYTWVPDWLVARLRARESECGAMIFRAGESSLMASIAECWRVRLNRIFEMAQPFEDRPTPHRFRHTFARILLEKGVPVADVAELIGDTEEIVRRHYDRWVPERQARLPRILKEAFKGKPGGKPSKTSRVALRRVTTASGSS